tara:strand:+ start:177 stop:743 length:567 start_codon:yes stop_codon:yes gene_type:complete
MAPKRGDTKTQNGVKYRYGYKNGKLQWIKAHTGLNLVKATNKKLLKIRKGVTDLGKGVSRRVFGNPKTSANQKYQSETWTKKPNNKMATWRVDDKENKKLQEEHKSGSDHTYQRVTSKNKNNLSSQQNKKDSSNKTLGNETKQQFLERTKNSPAAKAFGNSAAANEKRWAARQNYLRFLEKRKKKNKK